MTPLLLLATALAIGLLVGVERGWRNRKLADGTRIAGLRTFGLFGLLGGIYRHEHSTDVGEQVEPRNPLELGPALLFGALLAVVALLGKGMVEWLGEEGVLYLAVASGIADVDAINLTLTRMAGSEILAETAVLGIILASVSNSLLKAGLAVFSGGTGMLRWVLLPLTLTSGAGLLSAWLM